MAVESLDGITFDIMPALYGVRVFDTTGNFCSKIRYLGAASKAFIQTTLMYLGHVNQHDDQLKQK